MKESVKINTVKKQIVNVHQEFQIQVMKKITVILMILKKVIVVMIVIIMMIMMIVRVMTAKIQIIMYMQKYIIFLVKSFV